MPVPKHMGVAEQQLFHHAVAHVVHGEAPCVLLDVRVEHHLHQHVAQLLPEQCGILRVDGLRRLVCLLQQSAADALVRLHPIPRAALGRAQQPDDLQQVVVVITGFPCKI